MLSGKSNAGIAQNKKKYYSILLVLIIVIMNSQYLLHALIISLHCNLVFSTTLLDG